MQKALGVEPPSMRIRLRLILKPVYTSVYRLPLLIGTHEGEKKRLRINDGGEQTKYVDT